MGAAAPLLLALLHIALGCSDDTTAADAAADTGRDGAPPLDAMPVEVVPDPPMPAALPVLTPCPDGWSEVDVAGVTTCEPWTRADGPGCAAGEARFVGESCAPLGHACPSDGVPTDLPAGPVIHVSAGATMGDGSLGAPFGTIAEATAAAVDGDVIAVHSGTYTEAVDLSTPGVTLIGACTAETIIDAPDGPVSSAAVLMTADVSVSRITVRGGRPGLRAQGATGTVSDVWVESSFMGVVVTGAGALVANGLVVRDIAPGTSFGYGFFVNAGATLEVHRGLFEDLHAFGLAMSDSGSSALFEDVAFRDTNAAPDGTLGTALAVQGEAVLTIRRSVVEGAISAGILAQLDAEATIEDVLVRDIVHGTSPDDGFGIAAVTRGIAHGSRVRVHAATSTGLAATGFSSEISAEDVVVHDMRPSGGEGGGGAGAFYDTGASGVVERILVHRGVGASIGFLGTDLDVVIRDATCLDTQVDAAVGVSGVGFDVRMQAHATIERALVNGAVAAGLVVSSEGALLDASDLQVQGVRPTPASDTLGRGASIQLGAELDCARCAFHDAVEAGVLIHSSIARFSDLRVEDIASSNTSGAGMGVVVVVGDAGNTTIERFLVRRGAVAGVQIADGGDLTLRDGVIADNPIGVNVQDAPPDQSALSDGVVYRDNGQNLDATSLPVPEAGPF